MYPVSTIRNQIAAVGMLLCLNYPLPGLAGETDSQAVREWLDQWGDKWYERYHRDLDSRYPGGRSDHYHNIYIEERLRELPENTASEWRVFNRQYILDGNWFAVEWIYEAVQETSGRKQRESTLAIGKIVDDRLQIWVEYFDDMVGRYQWIGAMRLHGEDEEPYPWPADTALSREYRP